MYLINLITTFSYVGRKQYSTKSTSWILNAFWPDCMPRFWIRLRHGCILSDKHLIPLVINEWLGSFLWKKRANDTCLTVLHSLFARRVNWLQVLVCWQKTWSFLEMSARKKKWTGRQLIPSFAGAAKACFGTSASGLRKIYRLTAGPFMMFFF